MLLSSSAQHKLLSFLFERDGEIARVVQARACPHCGGRLDVANYWRKGRGWPPDAPTGWRLRFSFCCREEGCRRRSTPPSLRFLGRAVYLGIWVAAAGLWLASSARARAEACRRRDRDRRTWGRWLCRWRRWVTSHDAQELRARLAPSLHPLPVRLWSSLVHGSGSIHPPWPIFLAHLSLPAQDSTLWSSLSMEG